MAWLLYFGSCRNTHPPLFTTSSCRSRKRGFPTTQPGLNNGLATPNPWFFYNSLLSHFGPWNNSLNCFLFPTKYGIPKSLKVSHWLSEIGFQMFVPSPKIVGSDLRCFSRDFSTQKKWSNQLLVEKMYYTLENQRMSPNCDFPTIRFSKDMSVFFWVKKSSFEPSCLKEMGYLVQLGIILGSTSPIASVQVMDQRTHGLIEYIIQNCWPKENLYAPKKMTAKVAWRRKKKTSIFLAKWNNIIFHQPRFPLNKGNSLTKPQFRCPARVRSL